VRYDIYIYIYIYIYDIRRQRVRSLDKEPGVTQRVLVLQEMKRDAFSRHVVTRVMVLVTVSASLLDSSTYTSTANPTEETDVETRPGNFQC
jgi:hypothetical protein